MSSRKFVPQHMMNCMQLASHADTEVTDVLIAGLVARTDGDFVRHSTLVDVQTGASVAFSEYWPSDAPENSGTAITVMKEGAPSSVFVQTFDRNHKPEWPQYANRQTALDAAAAAEKLLGIDDLDGLRHDLLTHMYGVALAIGKGREPVDLGVLPVHSSLGQHAVGDAVKKVVGSMMSSSIYTRDYLCTTDDSFLHLQERSIVLGPNTRVLRDSPVLQLLFRSGPNSLTFRYLKSMLGKRASSVQPNSDPESMGLLEELPDNSDPKRLHLKAIISELIDISIKENVELSGESPSV